MVREASGGSDLSTDSDYRSGASEPISHDCNCLGHAFFCLGELIVTTDQESLRSSFVVAVSLYDCSVWILARPAANKFEIESDPDDVFDSDDEYDYVTNWSRLPGEPKKWLAAQLADHVSSWVLANSSYEIQFGPIFLLPASS